MSSSKSNALTAGLGYTIGNILIRCISILTLPLFSRIMGTEEFGVFNVFMSYDAVLHVIVGFALHSSVRSANIEFKGYISEYTSCISLVYIISAAVLSLIVLVFSNSISSVLGFSSQLLYLLIIHSFSAALLTLYNTRLSIDYSYKKYLIAALINSVGSIVISLLLMLTVFSNQKDVGRIVGSTLVLAILAISILINFFRSAKPKFNKKYLSFGLKYSLPVVPHGISQILLAQFDRVMISKIVSDSRAGIYSLAGNLKIVMTVITTSISAAWNTWFFEQMDKGEKTSIQKRAIQLAALYTILCVGLIAISPEMIFILGGREYDLAKFVAIPMILDALVLFFYDLVVSGEYYVKKTVNIMLATIGAAILNVVLNYIFILKFGFIAAAYTTLFCYVIYLAVHIIICRKMVKFFVLPIKWILIFSGIAVIMAAASLLLINTLVLRWLICAVIVIPMSLILLKNVGGVKELVSSIKGGK